MLSPHFFSFTAYYRTDSNADESNKRRNEDFTHSAHKPNECSRRQRNGRGRACTVCRPQHNDFDYEVQG